MVEPIFSSIGSQPEASVMDRSVIHTYMYVHVHMYMYILYTNIPKFIVTQLFVSLLTQQLSTLIIWLLSNLESIRIHTTSSSNTYKYIQDPCITIWYIFNHVNTYNNCHIPHSTAVKVEVEVVEKYRQKYIEEKNRQVNVLCIQYFHDHT